MYFIAAAPGQGVRPAADAIPDDDGRVRMDAATVARLEEFTARLRTAGWKERDAVKADLLAYAQGSPERAKVREWLEHAKKELPLEVRWEVDEVIEAITPPPAPPPEEPKKPEPPPSNRITAADLNLVYDDPRGLMLYRTKKPPERWFATQVDPGTGRPQTFELRPEEVAALRQQLAGSPYWLLGAG